MNIKELKEAAEKATPGPWEMEPMAGKGAWIGSKNGAEWTALSCGDSHQSASYNGQFIALANPSTILSLISRVEALEEALGGLVLCHDLFLASSGNQSDAYYLLAKQYTAWDAARAALQTTPKEAEE